MRVTNYFATQRAIRALAESREQLDQTLERITSGRRLQVASDDPTAALGVMQGESQLRASEQYRRNISSASSRASTEDSVLDRLTSLLTRAKELAVSQASDTATVETRRATAAEANQLLADAVTLANTRFGDEYLFGGYQSTVRPFTSDASAPAFTFTVATPPPSGSRAVEIASGQSFVATHDGVQLFGDATGGPLAALQSLSAALVSGDRDAIATSTQGIDAALERTEVLVAETGARANQLLSVDATHRQMAIDLESGISDLRDIDLEEAITALTGRQTAFQAAMAATARISGLTLTDYIR